MGNKTPLQFSYFTAFFMAAVAGFSDVFGFIALDHLFTAHVTGNIVIIIAFLIYSTKGIAAKILAIPLFMLFAIIISALIERHGYSKKMLIFWIIFEMALFFLLMVFGLTILPHLLVTSIFYISICMLPICAMAIHNTLLRTYMPNLPPCTVMTGNFTQFTVDLTALGLSYFYGKVTPPQRSITHLKCYGNVLLGFVVGGLLSALGFITMGFYCLIGIILLLAIILYHIIKMIDDIPTH